MATYKKIIRARAPLRITFGGGSTDHSPYDEQFGGVCVNATISKYVYATLKTRNDDLINIRSDIINKDDGFNTHEENLNSINDMKLNSSVLDLIKATILEMNPEFGFDLYVRSDVPLHSGLGASTALGASIIGIFNHLREDNKLDKNKIAETIHFIENKKINNLLGRQDPYAAVFGGLNIIKCDGGNNVTINKINIPERHLLDLEKNLIIVNQRARAKASGKEYERMHSNNVFNDEDKLKLLHGSKQNALSMAKSLQNTDLRRFGELIGEVWEKKKKYNPLSTDNNINNLLNEAAKNGAIGSKLMGGGGGGHLLIYCTPDTELKIKSVLNKIGAESLDFSFDHEGLKVWEADE
tara:strand:- start:5151 stop:6209 length:1059 start_codon:yes stop_codon:yes gene_type:complete